MIISHSCQTDIGFTIPGKFDGSVSHLLHGYNIAFLEFIIYIFQKLTNDILDIAQILNASLVKIMQQMTLYML